MTLRALPVSHQAGPKAARHRSGSDFKLLDRVPAFLNTFGHIFCRCTRDVIDHSGPERARTDLGMIGRTETFYQVVPGDGDDLVADAKP